jgi:hypothetical protein
MTLPTSPRRMLVMRSTRWAWLVAGAVVVPIALFGVVQPDWYYMQNGLDPFFYTGYVQNFQNLFHAVGDDHYFISRWTIYLPQRLLLSIFDDPKAAFLLFRWFGASVIVASVLSLHRDRWRKSDALALAALVLVMPISLRALLTDYSDAVVFPLGTAMIVLLAVHPERRRAAAMAGALLGAIVVANPFGATLAVAAAPFWLNRVPRRRWLPLLAAAAAGGAVVVVSGLLFFRWRYGIPNIYAPTIDFIRDQGTSPDPLKSPRLWWLGYRLWIYLPPLLVAAYHVMRRRYHFEFSGAERAIVSTCTLQYLIQVWYQFSLHGSSLELSYYWSYIAPAFGLTFCVVVGALAQRCGRWHLPAVTVVVVVALRVIGSPTPEVFQSWIDAMIVVGVLAYVASRIIASRPALVSIAFVGLIVLVQTSAPRPEPILPGEYRVQSAYELLYDNDRSSGVRTFEDVTWFVDEMERVPEPVVRSAMLWFNTELGARMAAMFGAQVSGRSYNPDWSANVATDPLRPDVVAALEAGRLTSIIVIGTAADVQAVTDQFWFAEPTLNLVLDAAAPNQSTIYVQVLSTLG